MKSIILPCGLRRRTVTCLTKAGIPIEKDAITKALKDGTLVPFQRPRNYGIYTHREVCRWAGIDPFTSPRVIAPENLTRKTANCLTKAGIPIEKDAIIQALKNGTLYPCQRPRNYGVYTHREVCRWAGVDPFTLPPYTS